VAIAGGFSPRALRDRVTVTHTDASGTARFVVPPGSPISPGDTVLVKNGIYNKQGITVNRSGTPDARERRAVVVGRGLRRRSADTRHHPPAAREPEREENAEH